MSFPHLNKTLNEWAEFTPDNPIARNIAPTLDQVTKSHRVSGVLRADLLCLLSAVYQGGHDAGRQTTEDAYGVIPKVWPVCRIWEVWTTVDEYGRHGEQIGYYGTKEAAKEAAQGAGWFGGEGSYVDYDAIQIDDIVYIIRGKVKATELNVSLPELRKRKKAEALAKLTAEDKQLLGIVE